MVDFVALQNLLGTDAVRAPESAPEHAVSSWSPAVQKRKQQGAESALPGALVLPPDEDSVIRLVRYAVETGTALYPVGGASNTVEATRPRPEGVAVNLQKLRGLSLIEDALLASVGAGWPLAELETTLNARGFTLGQVPRSYKLLTLGGAAAVNAIGAVSGKYGRFSDIVTGLSVVTGTGEFLRLQEAAPFNLLPLFLGTEGQLGILTALTLKIRPQPELQAWFAFGFSSFRQAIDAVRLIYSTDSRPSLVRAFDPEAARRLSPGTPGLLLASVLGDEVGQTGQYQLAHAVCQTLGGAELPSPLGDEWYSRWEDTGFLSANAHPGGLADILAVGGDWSVLHRLEAALREALAPLVTRLSVELCHPTAHGAALEFFWEAQASPPTPEAALALYDRILEAACSACRDTGGSLAHHYGVGASRRRFLAEERGETTLKYLRSLKALFDPDQILNPGAAL